ncbi:hypothetical protein AMJ57_00440 [Parcubacteria bacterium SG8_24]|nr:MAG: hypothetical protein AMJ57_00440 [Parcubacteria bacterium SG8_24]
MPIFELLITHNTLLAGILSLGLATWVYLDDRERPVNITFGALLMAVSLWFFSYALWQSVDEPRHILFWLRMLLFVGSLLPVLFFFFGTTLSTNRLPALWLQTAALLPNLVILLFVFFSDRVVFLLNDVSTQFGPGRVTLTYHFALFFLATLGTFVYASRQKRPLYDRTRLAAAAIGAVVAFNSIFAVLSMSSAAQDTETFWIANIALVGGMLLTIASAVKKSIILDLKMVGVELFIMLTISVIATDMVVSESILDLTFRLVLLVVLVFFGVLTLKSLINEVRRLREIETLNEQIMQMNGRLIEADKMKTRFVSFASHQMRAPLGGIRSYLYMMIDGDFGKLTDQQESIMRVNVDALERLQQTIETFLNVTKIESGSFDFYKTRAPLQQLVERVVKQLQPAADRKRLEMVMELPLGLPPVMIDSGKMFHVLVNLIDNSIKYTDEGSIRLTAHEEGDHLVFLVTDTGRGLDEREKNNIMRVIREGLKEVKFEETGGSGLGLHIANKIIEGHGGEMVIQSEGRGKGSTVGFRIPLS